MAVRALRLVQKQILKHPKTYNQSRDRNPECGSPSCIIGWMKFLTRKWKLGYWDMMTTAQHGRLYWANYWPGKFCVSCGSAWASITAKTAARRIDVFIKSDGRK